MASNTSCCARHSRKFCGAELLSASPARALFVSDTETIRLASSNGSPRRTIASTTEKIAVLAPMPSARTISAVVVNPGAARSARIALRRSDHMSHPLRRGERVDQLRHPLARGLVRQPANAAADVLEHVRRLGRPRTSNDDARVAEDVLDEE